MQRGDEDESEDYGTWGSTLKLSGFKYFMFVSGPSPREHPPCFVATVAFHYLPFKVGQRWQITVLARNLLYPYLWQHLINRTWQLKQLLIVRCIRVRKHTPDTRCLRWLTCVVIRKRANCCLISSVPTCLNMRRLTMWHNISPSIRKGGFTHSAWESFQRIS